MGSHNTISGTKISTNSASSKAAKKGQISRIMSASLIPVVPLITNSKMPYGGVIKPTMQLITATTPKCTRSIHMARQACKNSGMMTRMMVVASKIHPSNKSNTFTPNKKVNGDTSNDCSVSANKAGMFSEATM